MRDEIYIICILLTNFCGFVNFSSFSPCCLWFFSACRLGRWEKWLACLVIHGCILILPYLSFSRILSNSQFMFDQCICIYLTFVWIYFRENTDQYVFLCFAHTHFIFIWSFIFFTVTGMIHLLFHVLINCIKVRPKKWIFIS